MVMPNKLARRPRCLPFQMDATWVASNDGDLERIVAVQRALDIVQRSVRAVIGAGFLFALGLNFANVVMRYIFHAPIYWAEEVMIFTFVWCVFLGAALVTLSGDHLRVEFLQWVLPRPARLALAAVIHLTAAVVMLFVAWRAVTLLDLIMRLEQKSIIAEIPMVVPYGAVLVGSILMSAASFIRASGLVVGAVDPRTVAIGGREE
jgi:TRAP-type C4-dicarboxylate transport system permease small subunit